MATDDTVTAKLAEWEALVRENTEGDLRADLSPIARALLGFVEDVRALHVSSSESRGVGRVDPETGEWGAYCDHDSEWWPCATAQAVQKWIGGEE